MAVFAASFTVSQSADCSTLTFVDTSNYVTNDSGLQIPDFQTREFLVSNYNSELIATLPLTGTAVSATFALSADAWLSVELNLETLAPVSTFTETHSVLSTCYLEKCYAELVADTECGCGCNGGSCSCGDSTSNDKVRLLEYIKAAEIFSEYSNPVLAQKQLDAGTALCNANENN
jgi:hypothetical protein